MGSDDLLELAGDDVLLVVDQEVEAGGPVSQRLVAGSDQVDPARADFRDLERLLRVPLGDGAGRLRGGAEGEAEGVKAGLLALLLEQVGQVGVPVVEVGLEHANLGEVGNVLPLYSLEDLEPALYVARPDALLRPAGIVVLLLRKDTIIFLMHRLARVLLI